MVHEGVNFFEVFFRIFFAVVDVAFDGGISWLIIRVIIPLNRYGWIWFGVFLLTVGVFCIMLDGV